MTVASEAEEDWWPPTFSPSGLSRRWLALWIIQVDSHSALRSSSDRKGRRGSVMAALLRMRRSIAREPAGEISEIDADAAARLAIFARFGADRRRIMPKPRPRRDRPQDHRRAAGRRAADDAAARRAGRPVGLALRAARAPARGGRGHQGLCGRRSTRTRSACRSASSPRSSSSGSARRSSTASPRAVAQWPEVLDCYLMTGPARLPDAHRRARPRRPTSASSRRS